jgi:hypothetical protein
VCAMETTEEKSGFWGGKVTERVVSTRLLSLSSGLRRKIPITSGEQRGGGCNAWLIYCRVKPRNNAKPGDRIGKHFLHYAQSIQNPQALSPRAPRPHIRCEYEKEARLARVGERRVSKYDVRTFV